MTTSSLISLSDVASAALKAAEVPADAPIAVAVSGGADSMALVIALNAVHPIIALTVDHGLRDEAALEAAEVHTWLSGAGIEHHILKRKGSPLTANIQARARAARYGLMDEFCRDRGIGYLATAHHADDQAETFLMRLARGSGVYGLAAMSHITDLPWSRAGVKLLRPLLTVTKADCEQALKDIDQPWIEDPSNENDQFERVKARQILADSTLKGLDNDKLAKTAERMTRAAIALDHYADKLLSQAVERSEYGFASVDVTMLKAEPEEVGLRSLSRLVRHLGGAEYAPRLEKLESLYAALGTEDYKGSTLGGCQVIALNDKVIIGREGRAAERTPVLRKHGLWDGRFEVTLDRAGRVAALGDDGWSQIARKVMESPAMIIPHPLRLSMPALWIDGKVVAQPAFGFGSGFEAEFRPLQAL